MRVFGEDGYLAAAVGVRVRNFWCAMRGGHPWGEWMYEHDDGTYAITSGPRSRLCQRCDASEVITERSR